MNKILNRWFVITFFAIVLIGICSISYVSSKSLGQASTTTLNERVNNKYYAADNKTLLKLMEGVDWSDESNLPLIEILSKSIYELNVSVPSKIEKSYPEITDFIDGYISTRNGEIKIANSYFKSLEFKDQYSKQLSSIGRMSLFEYTNDVAALCGEVKKQEKVKNTSRYWREVLLDYKLKCMVFYGNYQQAKEILEEYKPNGINDMYKKNLLFIDVMAVLRDFDGAEKLLSGTKDLYGSTENLLLTEANLIAQKEGYAKEAKFLKKHLNKESFNLNTRYAISLANSDINQAKKMLVFLEKWGNRRKFDIPNKLNLAHYSFNYGFKVPLDRVVYELSHIKNIEEFVSFNLLEAKLALLKKNYEKTNAKLKEISKKNPYSVDYLWFSYEYNKLLGKNRIAKQYLIDYLKVDPNNQIAKEHLNLI